MKIIKILIIFLTLYITVASNMFSELKLDLGIENLLIKKYFIEEVINYTNGTINSIVQQETIETNREKFLKSTISIEKTVFDENMNIGIEIGILSSISENKNTWYNPQKTNNFNGEIIIGAGLVGARHNGNGSVARTGNRNGRSGKGNGIAAGSRTSGSNA